MWPCCGGNTALDESCGILRGFFGGVKADFAFLQEGEYVVEVQYRNSPAGNAVLVYSDQMTGEDNRTEKEYVRQSIEKGDGSVRIALNLEEGVHGIHVCLERDREEEPYLAGVNIQGTGLENRDNYFLGGLCFTAAVIFLLLGWYLPWKKYAGPLIMVLLGLGASLPLFAAFMIDGDDLGFHMIRIEGIYQGIKAGTFPVYVNGVQMAGYGSLSSTMYPQLFLYPAALLRFLGVSLVLCYKILLVAVNAGTALIMFYAVKNISGSVKTAYMAAFLYTFSLYRLINIYFRAALGEGIAMVFLPLVLWGIYEILWGNHKKWYLLMLGMTGVLQSHVLSVEMCVLFLLAETVYWGFSTRFRHAGGRILAGLKAAAGTCLLNAFFIVPFLYFCRQPLQVFHMSNNVGNMLLYFSQVFAVFPNARRMESGGPGTVKGEMPVTIGGVLLIGVALFMVMTAKRRQKETVNSLGRHCLCLGSAAVLFTSWIFPWKSFLRNPFFSQITTPLQFSWRFLGPASVFLCIVSAVGIVLFLDEGNGREWMAGIVILATLCSATFYFDKMSQEANQWVDKMAMEGRDDCDALYMYWRGGEYENLQTEYRREDACIRTSGPGIVCRGYRKRGTEIWVRLLPPGDADSWDTVSFPLYYYPGYEIEVNGIPTEVFPEGGLVACSMPEDAADIHVWYRGLPAFRIANGVTLAVALGMAAVSLAHFRRFMVAKRRKKS